MKPITKVFILSVLVLCGMGSCKKDEHRVIFTGGTAPVLASSATGNIALSYLTPDEQAVSLSWTNPNFQFNTGISSLNVNYNLEIDTTGVDFTSSHKVVLSVGTDLSKTFTQSQLNDNLLKLKLNVGTSYNIEMRVTALILGGSEPLISNVLKFSATAYLIPPKVVPPTDSTLWLTGDATNSGYDNPLPPPYDVSQKFQMMSPTLYELTVTMKGGGAYKLIQEQGNWDTQYHMITGGTWDAGNFEKKNSDPGFPGTPSGGKYKIQVDFQTGTYNVTKL